MNVNEIFRSIQGESTWAGLPCVFVRLSGCNLACRYCDTEYASREPGLPMTQSAVLARVRELAGVPGPGASAAVPLVEVTGGEPLAQAETPALLAALADLARVVLLETNGSLPLPVDRRFYAILDVKCPGSGMAGHMCWENLSRLRSGDEVKFAVGDRTDFDYAEAVVRQHGLAGRGLPLLISPLAGALPTRELAAWILASHLPLRLQLQLHKVIWPEISRGV